jgi:hypothetical protein
MVSLHLCHVYNASLGVRWERSAGGWTMRRMDVVSYWLWMTISPAARDWFVLILYDANLSAS